MKRTVQVYRVTAMDTYEVEGADAMACLLAALQKARGGFASHTPDCRFVAVIPEGAWHGGVPEKSKVLNERSL